jgi:hypothetical protein
MGTVGLFAYTIAVGFVAAGLIASIYQLLTSRQIAFELLFQHSKPAIVGIVALVMAGPAVIMRNAIRGRLVENRPGHWLALSTMLSAGWSFLQGVFILSLVVSARGGGLV